MPNENAILSFEEIEEIARAAGVPKDVVCRPGNLLRGPVVRRHIGKSAALRRQTPQPGQPWFAGLSMAQAAFQHHPTGGELLPGSPQAAPLLNGQRPAAEQAAEQIQGLGLMPAGGQGGADVDQLQLQRGGPPEGIDLEVKRGVHPGAQSHAALLRRHGEENCVKPAGTLGETEF